jgi:predicted Zn finger-like uncharacterized protein
MYIKCPNCKKSYKINSEKIPPHLTTAKCKACGQAISLKEHRTDTKRPDKAENKITCLYCNKTYRVNWFRIPKGATTIKCKSCGHVISLAPRHPTSQRPKKALKISATGLNASKIANSLPPVRPTPAQPSTPFWRKPWLLAAVLALIVVGLGVIYSSPHISKFLSEESGEKQDPEKVVQRQAENLPKPFLNLDINLPLALEALDRRIPDEKKDTNYENAVSVINSLDANRLEIYLYSDPKHTVLPVAVLHTSDPNRLETKIKKAIAIHTILEHMPDGSYQLKKEAIPAKMQNDFPIDIYRVLFWKKGAIVAPKSLLPELENPENLNQTLVGQMAAAIETPHHLGSLAIRIPENLKAGWEEKIQDLPGVKDNLQIAMAAAMGSGLLAKMTEPFEKIDALALGFRFDGDGPRTLSYAQRFRDGVDGAKIYQAFNSGDKNDLNVDGIVLNLIELIQNPQYQQTIEFKENKLALEFTWSAADDTAFISELSQATIGQLFAQGMQLEPTEGSITTNYTDESVLTASVNVDKLKKSIPETVKQRIFPGNYWDAGDDPHMTLTLDPVDIPNAVLAELTFDVLSVKTSSGKEVMRQVENQFKFKINPGSTTPGHITLNIQKGTPATALGTAKIRFNLLLPAVLEQIEFKSEALSEQKDINGVVVKLDRLEKDVAKVEYRGAEDIRLFAYDSTRRALASHESVSGSSSVAARFQGVIAKLKVVAVKKRRDVTFDVDVDLNGGKALELSHKPEIPKRVRYSSNPVRKFVPYTMQNLENLTVEWQEGSQMSWNDNLAILLPMGPFNGLVDWEVHFFGQDKPLYLAGNSFSAAKKTSFSLEKGELQKAHAAFGSVKFNLASDIHRLGFVKDTNGKSVEQILASGQKVIASFNKNEITVGAGKLDIIQIMAYDARGRHLKKGDYTRHKDGKIILYFWGVPKKLELDVVSNKIEKTIHFDIKQRPVQEKAYVKFQRDIENQGEVIKTLKAIAKARRKNRTGYGDDLAGLYYVYDRKKKKPMKLIERKIAHSDPTGQKRFGYTLKPYKGYYFTVLAGTESNGVQKEYPKQSKKKQFFWDKGTFQTIPYIQAPDMVVIPLDKSQPTFFLQWNQVYMKQLNGVVLKHLPLDFYNQGWVEAKFIEG